LRVRVLQALLREKTLMIRIPFSGSATENPRILPTTACQPIYESLKRLSERLGSSRITIWETKKPALSSRKIVESGWLKMDHFSLALASLTPEA
jgi:hypothetical protein